MNFIALYVDVPCATFRQSRSREYGKTYPIPPPSTVYGMLLSFVGETDAQKHCGVKLAISMLSQPRKSQVLRQIRRFRKNNQGNVKNTIPEPQEIVTNIKFIVWVESSQEEVKPNLVKRIEKAIAKPFLVERFGCLYLGESSDLVNSIRLASEYHLNQPKQWLVPDNKGNMTLPFWVDHIGSKGTRWQRCSLKESHSKVPLDNSWIVIQKP